MTTPTPDPTPTTPPTGFTLWFRPGRGAAWEAVAAAPTEAELTSQVGVGGRRNVAWLALPAGRHPDRRKAG